MSNTVEDYSEGVRQILGVIDAAWAPTGHVIIYPNRNTQPPRESVPWARVTLKHVTGEQRTIQQPSQLYTQRGVLIVQIFTPAGSGIGGTLHGGLVSRIQAALRGVQTQGGVFFTKVSPEEVGIDGPWFQTNVSCTWQYDERT